MSLTVPVLAALVSTRTDNSIGDSNKARGPAGPKQGKNKGQREDDGELCENRAEVKEGWSPGKQWLRQNTATAAVPVRGAGPGERRRYRKEHRCREGDSQGLTRGLTLTLPAGQGQATVSASRREGRGLC